MSKNESVFVFGRRSHPGLAKQTKERVSVTLLDKGNSIPTEVHPCYISDYPADYYEL